MFPSPSRWGQASDKTGRTCCRPHDSQNGKPDNLRCLRMVLPWMPIRRIQRRPICYGSFGGRRADFEDQHRLNVPVNRDTPLMLPIVRDACLKRGAAMKSSWLPRQTGFVFLSVDIARSDHDLPRAHNVEIDSRPARRCELSQQQDPLTASCQPRNLGDVRAAEQRGCRGVDIDGDLHLDELMSRTVLDRDREPPPRSCPGRSQSHRRPWLPANQANTLKRTRRGRKRA